MLYAPDYVVNAGGLIQVADELEGFSFERAQARAEKIFDTTKQVFALADEDGVPPSVAADRHRRAADARGRAGCAASGSAEHGSAGRTATTGRLTGHQAA